MAALGFSFTTYPRVFTLINNSAGQLSALTHQRHGCGDIQANLVRFDALLPYMLSLHLPANHFTTTFLPLIMFIPRCGLVRRCPERLKIGAVVVFLSSIVRMPEGSFSFTVIKNGASAHFLLTASVFAERKLMSLPVSFPTFEGRVMGKRRIAPLLITFLSIL